jgi:hypothetical protein
MGTILMDLSKAYDCLPHNLLIAKLAAYGVDHFSLSFIYNYLSNRKHRVRINDTFSNFLDILLGVPQGSILGPLLFNIFLNDLLLFARESELCNFADDNTLYSFGKTVNQVKSILKTDIKCVLHWFEINQMAANPAKFQVMFLGAKEPVTDFVVDNILFNVTNSVKLLGITIDNKLNFKCHTQNLCGKASSKTKALTRIRPFLSIKTAMALYNAYILSTFNYCLLIWMNFVMPNNARITKVHCRALRVVFQNFDANISELPALENGVSLHISFIRKLLVKIFKSLHGLNSTFISELFIPKSSRYSLRSGQQLALPPIHTVTFVNRSLSFMGSLLWDRVPNFSKDSTNLSQLKKRMTNLLQL